MKTLALLTAVTVMSGTVLAQPLAISARFAAPSTLPMLPMSIEVFVENRGNTVSYYAPAVAYRFVESDGRRALVLGQHGDVALDGAPSRVDDDAEVVMLGARERRSHFLDIRLDLSGPVAFCSPRLAEPGEYSIEVGIEQLSSAVPPDRVPGWTDPNSPSLQRFVWSAPTKMLVRAPEGIDAAALAYARSQGLRPCGWSDFALDGGADELRRKHPNSRYSSYAAGPLAIWSRDLSHEQRRDILVSSAAAKTVDPAFRWYLNLAAVRAESHGRLSRKVDIVGKLKDAAVSAPSVFAKSLAEAELALEVEGP